MFGGLQGTDLIRFGMGVLGGRDLNHGLSQGLGAALPAFEQRQAKKKWEGQLAEMDVSPQMRQALTMMGPKQGSAMYAQHLFQQAQPKAKPQMPWFVQQDGSLHPAKQKLMQMQRGPQQARRDPYAERATAAQKFGMKEGSPDYRRFVLTGRLQSGSTPVARGAPTQAVPRAEGIGPDGKLIFAQSSDSNGFSVTPLQRRDEEAISKPPGPVPTLSVPNVVINPKSEKIEKYATEQLRAFAATHAATPEQRERLRNFDMQQAAWRRRFGKAPTGHYYGPDGRLHSLKDSPPSISQQQSDKADAMLQRQQGELQNAEKLMLEAGPLGRFAVSNLDSTSAGRFAMGVVGGEKTAQAYTDYEQSVLSIVYNLSGKTTTNSEMERFLGAYMPRSGESDERVKAKTNKIRGMLTALQSAKAKGLSGNAAMRMAVADWRKHVPGAVTAKDLPKGLSKEALAAQVLERLKAMNQ